MSGYHPVVFFVGIVGILLPLMLLGGPSLATWRRLARVYPDRQFAVDRTFQAISGQVGGTFGVVERCLRVDVGNEGVRISTWPIFRRLLPPFMIPWSEITRCADARYYFSPEGARLDLAHWPQPIHLWPRLWRDENLPSLLQERWHEHTTKVL